MGIEQRPVKQADRPRGDDPSDVARFDDGRITGTPMLTERLAAEVAVGEHANGAVDCQRREPIGVLVPSQRDINITADSG